MSGENKITISKIVTPSMSITALFTKVKTWKQPKFPSTDKWIKTIRFIYASRYFAALKKKVILPFVSILMDLEGIILSGISHTGNKYFYVLTYI